MSTRKLHNQSNCIHTEKQYQGVNTPIYPSTANRYIGYEENVYPRYFNTENQQVIVEKLCKLEQGEAGLIFSSGMAAISTAFFSLLKAGDHVLLSTQIYGGTYRFIVEELPKYGIFYDFIADLSETALQAKLKSTTRILYTESPSNPLLSVVDLKAAAALAKANNLISIVDNTFASPINQQPLALGIDVVVHSGTKYLGGHSDLSFGAVITSAALRKVIHSSALDFGGNLNPLDCYLIERSLKTLAVRVERHNANATKMAEFLSGHPNVSRVHYPGLTAHPDHDLASRQMTGGFGGMLSFELKNAAGTAAFLDRLQMIVPALSLGGVESTICQPTKTSHAKMPEKERLAQGITEGLLRLSVGIEHIDDLIADIENAWS